ncbi:MAG: ATP-binding protein [Candidatus Ratteibacteria bacterium]|jgi:lon-related putative ATP-dependent protease
MVNNNSKRLELKAEEVRADCPEKSCPYENTLKIPPLEGIIGQNRAARSLEFGLKIQKPGFNIYVSGISGTGRTTSVDAAVTELAGSQPVPEDWCYVHNFEDPDRPRALRFPPGLGRTFQKDIDTLIEELKIEVPRAFESKEYDEQRNQITQAFQEKRQKIYAGLEKKAEQDEFSIKQTATGLLLLPIMDGKTLSEGEYEKLGPAEKEFYRKKQEKLHGEISEMMRQFRQREKEDRIRIQDLDRETGTFTTKHHFDELYQKYHNLPEVTGHLGRIQKELVEHIQDFLEKEEAEILPGLKMPAQKNQFLSYRVNLLVDNSQTKGAPVVKEGNPTYFNLIGRQESRPQFGSFVTDFTMIKAGALHRANGGYLILQANDLFTQYFSWQALKRCLKNGTIQIEDLAEEFHLISTPSMRPEPIPISTKIIIIGNPYVYQLLFAYDEDFPKLFKVKADFDYRLNRDQEGIRQYAGFISQHCKENNLLPFHRSAVARVVEYGSRLVEDQQKLTSRFREVADMLQEADYWARQDNKEVVVAADVLRATEEKVYRSNRIEERIREMIKNGQILLDDRGAVVGQVNGLAVIFLGDYMFGRPSRITARTFVGKEGILDIERETKLGGQIHTKGILILSGFLGQRYAHTEPLTLSASICFEQSYEEIEGDSASSAELYALLSSLADRPIKQGIAVTGSVNQKGEVQPIGGVNEKVEGFFEVCKIKGFTGEQGVIIPRTNVKNLMLKEEVVEAVAAGKFHVWAVTNVDEGIEILTGTPAGEQRPNGTFPASSINGLVAKRLVKLNGYYTESQKPARRRKKKKKNNKK